MVLDDLFGKPKRKKKRAKPRSALEKALGLPGTARKRRKPQSAAKKVENAVERAVGNAVEDMVTAAIKKITG